MRMFWSMRRFSLLASLATLACARGPSTESDDQGAPDTVESADPANPADSRDYVGKDAQVDFAQLRFADADEASRFARARECFARRGAEWEHFPLRKIGNFIEEDWCHGEGAQRGCEGSFRDHPDIDWAKVATLHYASDWPEVFGVQIDAGRRGSGQGWDVALYVSSNGKSIVGDGAHVDFRRADDWVHVGSSYAYDIAESHFSVQVDEDPWRLLERLRSSPEVLRDEGVTRWRELEAQVVAGLRQPVRAEGLDADQVRECEYGPYEGDGIPPTCTQVPLSAEREAEELRLVKAKVARVVELLETEYVAMHAVLVELAPVECF